MANIIANRVKIMSLQTRWCPSIVELQHLPQFGRVHKFDRETFYCYVACYIKRHESHDPSPWKRCNTPFNFEINNRNIVNNKACSYKSKRYLYNHAFSCRSSKFCKSHIIITILIVRQEKQIKVDNIIIL